MSIEKICGIATSLLKKNPEVRKALFESKKALNDLKLARGEIRGAQKANEEAKNCLDLLNAQEEAAFHNMGNQTHSAFMQTVKSEIRPNADYNSHEYLQTDVFWRDTHNAKVAEIMDTSWLESADMRKYIKKICDNNPDLKSYLQTYKSVEKAQMERGLTEAPVLDVVLANKGGLVPVDVPKFSIHASIPEELTAMEKASSHKKDTTEFKNLIKEKQNKIG